VVICTDELDSRVIDAKEVYELWLPDFVPRRQSIETFLQFDRVARLEAVEYTLFRGQRVQTEPFGDVLIGLLAREVQLTWHGLEGLKLDLL